jgi:hypothetical protein
MNRDDMISMAQEAGFEDHSNPELWDCMVVSHEAVKRFAALVAAAEREACAKVCDDVDKESLSQWPQRLATMIRARGEKQ